MTELFLDWAVVEFAVQTFAAPARRRCLLPHAGNASQEELMVKDECILVDEADNVTGHANKYKSHRCGGWLAHAALASCSRTAAGGRPLLGLRCQTAP
jgi:hypothetical protein